MAAHPEANNPFVYAGVGVNNLFVYARDGTVHGAEPTIAAYDPTKMLLVYGDRGYKAEYAPLPGYTMDSAKLAEFPISYIDERAIQPKLSLHAK